MYKLASFISRASLKPDSSEVDSNGAKVLITAEITDCPG